MKMPVPLHQLVPPILLSLLVVHPAFAILKARTEYQTTAVTRITVNAVNGASIEQLSQDITWQRLLLYKQGKSSISDQSFFISQQGRTHPQAELTASLEALSQAKTAQDFLCRFPARSDWLMRQLPNLKQQVIDLTDSASCPKVDNWIQQVDAKQFSLIHAEEQNNRIGSSTGHTFIKIDTTQSLATHDNDNAYFVNFASEQRNNESKAKTGLAAIIGRAKGVMSFDSYTNKQAFYLLEDQRDLWQYPLALTDDDITQIMRHLWELKSMKRYYSFTSNNCASEVLRLLDVVMPNRNLVNEAGNVITPPEVARTLSHNHLLKQPNFVPSLRTVKQAKINATNAMGLNNNQGFDQTFDRAYAKQAQLNALPRLIPSDNNPLNAMPFQQASIGIKHDDDTTSALLGFRTAHQDLLDRQRGKRDYLNVTLMAFNVAYPLDQDDANNDKKVKLADATLVDIFALNPKNSAKPQATWQKFAKISPIIDASDKGNVEHRVLDIGTGYGSSWVLGQAKTGTGELPDTLCYVLAQAQGQVGHINKGYRVGVGMHAGCSHHLNDKLRILAETTLPYWYQGENNRSSMRSSYFQPNISLAGQYDLSTHQAIRARIEHEKDNHDDNTVYGLSYHWFFD